MGLLFLILFGYFANGLYFLLAKDTTECFFEDISNDKRVLKVIYSCMWSGGKLGNLTFVLSDDRDNHLLTEKRFVYNTILYDVGNPGTYALCFKSSDKCKLTLRAEVLSNINKE